MAAISEARGSISIEHNFKVEEIEEGANTNGATSTTPSPNNKRRQKKPPQMSPENGELNWNCSVCTYTNAALDYKCAMCDAPKSTSTRKSKLTQEKIEAEKLAAQIAVYQDDAAVGAGIDEISKNKNNERKRKPSSATTTPTKPAATSNNIDEVVVKNDPELQEQLGAPLQTNDNEDENGINANKNKIKEEPTAEEQIKPGKRKQSSPQKQGLISVKEEFVDPSKFLEVKSENAIIMPDPRSAEGKNHIIHPMNSNPDQKPLINTVFPPPEFPVPELNLHSYSTGSGTIGGVARTDRNEVVFEQEYEGGWVKMVVARKAKMPGEVSRSTDCYVYAPATNGRGGRGKKLRSSNDLLKWILENPSYSEHLNPLEINFENIGKKGGLSFGTKKLIKVVDDIKSGVPLDQIKASVQCLTNKKGSMVDGDGAPILPAAVSLNQAASMIPSLVNSTGLPGDPMSLSAHLAMSAFESRMASMIPKSTMNPDNGPSMVPRSSVIPDNLPQRIPELPPMPLVTGGSMGGGSTSKKAIRKVIFHPKGQQPNTIQEKVLPPPPEFGHLGQMAQRIMLQSMAGLQHHRQQPVDRQQPVVPPGHFLESHFKARHDAMVNPGDVHNITYSYKGPPRLPLPPGISAMPPSKNTQLSISKKPEKIPIKIGLGEELASSGKSGKNAVLKLEEFFTQHNRIPGVDEMTELSNQLGISYLDVSKWFVQRWKNVLLAHGNENKRKNDDVDHPSNKRAKQETEEDDPDQYEEEDVTCEINPMEFLESEMVEGDDEGEGNANATDDNDNASYEPIESVFVVENEN